VGTVNHFSTIQKKLLSLLCVEFEFEAKARKTFLYLRSPLAPMIVLKSFSIAIAMLQADQTLEELRELSAHSSQPFSKSLTVSTA
jgi:hypothetical protein